MASFMEATAVVRDRPGGRYRGLLDAEWFAWGPFGGYLAAIAMRAVGAESSLPRGATFSGVFLNAGGPGEVDVQVESLRQGKRAEALRVTIAQQGKQLFQALCWMVGDDLQGLSHDHAHMPPVLPPGNLRPYSELADDFDTWFPFWRHIEGRPLQWYDPDSRPPHNPRWQGWLRLHEVLPADDPSLQAARALMWMDMAVWNAAVQAHAWPMSHIAPTLDLTLQLHGALYEADVADQPWTLIDGVSPTSGHGVLGGSATLWSPRGALLATGTSQCMWRPVPESLRPAT